MSKKVHTHPSGVLETTWQRYAEFDANALAGLEQHLRLQSWVVILSVAATLLAILVGNYSDQVLPIIGQVLRISLILVPIVSSIVLAFTNKFQQGERWLALRAGAEEIKKEIYLYRTLLQGHNGRDQWLNERVTAIQRQVFESFGGDLVLKSYTGKVPPRYLPEDDNGDPGFGDLLADEYLRYRLENQLKWHSQKIGGLQRTRIRLQWIILAFGGLGTFLAALGGSLAVWVAFTSSIAFALTAWLELRRLDSVVNHYSRLVLELTIIRDRWKSLSKEERTGDEFFKMVMATEKVLWSQHRVYITEMRQAVAELQGQDTNLLEQVVNSPAPPAIDEALLREARVAEGATETSEVETALSPGTAVEEQAVAETIGEKPKVPDQKRAGPKPQKGRPHAFVVMPFGRKQGFDGQWVDFDSIYSQLIKPGLEEAGFEPFRADEETISGDILTDMFQELLLADLVIADLSIDNANVFYELGVRHAMRKRGVVHIQSGRAYMPFDIFNVRTIPYHCDSHGKPDPDHLEKDKQAIVRVCRDTWASDQEAIHSPIFNLLTGLTEPDRKVLRTPLATGFWREYNVWKERVTIAQRQKRIGDVLLLTEEISNPLIQEEAISEAGKALSDMERHELALQQYRRGLEINSRNVEFRRHEAFHLNRLQRTDEAVVKLERLLQDEPTDTEAITYLGRIYKDMWRESWGSVKDERKRLSEAYNAAHWLVKSIHTYLNGYRSDLNQFHSGINALTLSAVLDHLAQQVGEGGDPEIESIRQLLPQLKGTLQFALEGLVQKDTSDYWTLASLGELAVSIAKDPKMVTRAYKKALTAARKSTSYLQTSIAQLELLDLLAFRPEYVKAGLAVLQGELNRIKDELVEDEEAYEKQTEEQVFLFSGHMVDRLGHPEPRFPAAMESEVRQKIEQALGRLHADSNDLAITAGAACGGDIIFIEACLQRKLKVKVLLPFSEAEYIKEAVSFAGDEWVTRFYNLRNHPDVTICLQPDHIGPVKEGDNVYERNNRWALYSALIYGFDRVHLIALWDGRVSDAFDHDGQLVSHMVQEMRHRGGVVEHLNTTKFDYWKAKGKVGRALDILARGE